MPSIKDAVAQNQARIAAGKPLVESVTPTPMEATSPGPGVPPDIQPGLPIRGVYTPNQILDTDFSAGTSAMRKGANLRSATFPPTAQPATVNKVAASTSVIQQVAATLLLKTNNIKNAIQNVQNVLAGTGINITSDANGNVTFTSTASGDGLVHGDPIWDVDSAVMWWRDDFYFGSAAVGLGGVSTLGELKWDSVKATTTIFNKANGFSPHFGQLRIDSGTTAGVNACIFAPLATTSDSGSTIAGVFSSGLPLLDYPGWKMVWVFGFPPARVPSTPTPFPLTQTQFYCGLAPLSGATTASTWFPNNVMARPAFFAGLRFDTDPGINAGAGTAITNVGNGDGIYTGSFPQGGSSAQAGYIAVMTGFTTPANNGTFVITASTTTNITTNNNLSSPTDTGTVTVVSIADTKFQFEVVSNPNFSASGRDNRQGTVVNTGITPTENVYYRFELISNVAGVVTMNLYGDDGSFATNTFSSVPTTVVAASGLHAAHSLVVNNGILQLNQSVALPFEPPGGTGSNPTWAPGSKVTITSATNAYFNKTWTMGGDGLASHWVAYTGDATNITETSSPSVWTGYPGLMPYFSWGNDTQATPVSTSVFLDFWACVINPGLAGLVPNSALSRYF